MPIAAMRLRQPSAPAAVVTLNPVGANPNLILSDGNMAVRCGVSGENRYGGVKATKGVSTGHWYWEISSIDMGGAPEAVIGIGNASASTADFAFPGNDANGVGWHAVNGNVLHGGGAVANAGAWNTGDILGFELNMDAGQLILWRNGVSQGVKFSGLVGTYFPLLALWKRVPTVHSARFASAAAQFAYPVPAGASPIDLA